MKNKTNILKLIFRSQSTKTKQVFSACMNHCSAYSHCSLYNNCQQNQWQALCNQKLIIKDKA